MLLMPRTTAPPKAQPVALTTHEIKALLSRERGPSDDRTVRAEPKANDGPLGVQSVPLQRKGGSDVTLVMAKDVQEEKELPEMVMPRDEAMVTAPDAKHHPMQRLELLVTVTPFMTAVMWVP